MHFVNSHTAHGLLRSLVEAMAEVTPSRRDILLKVKHTVKSSKRGLQTVNRLRAYFQPFMLHTMVGIQRTGYILFAYIPRFVKNDFGWELHIDVIEVRSCSDEDSMVYFSSELIFNGHALERFFQRANTIVRADIIAAIQDAVAYNGYWASLVRVAKPQRLLMPARNGVFIGNVLYKDYVYFEIKTFIRDGKERYDRVKARLVMMEKVLKDSHVKRAVTAELMGTNIEFARSQMLKLVQEEPWILEPYIQEEDSNE